MLFEITLRMGMSTGIGELPDETYGVLVEAIKHTYTRSELVEVLRERTEVVGINEIVRALDNCEGFYYISPDMGVFGAETMEVEGNYLTIRPCHVVDLDDPQARIQALDACMSACREGGLGRVLEELGFPVIKSRVPYTYHHDWYRTHQLKEEDYKGAMPSRGEVGNALSTRHGKQYDDYWYQCEVYFGTLEYFRHAEPQQFQQALKNRSFQSLYEGLRDHYKRIHRPLFEEVA